VSDPDAGGVPNVDRRTFLKRGLVAGGLLAGAGAAIWAAEGGGGSANPPEPPSESLLPEPPPGGAPGPNILVILVDQMRFPQWFSAARAGVGLPPNLARLRRGAVSFGGHYTASNDCSPARATLLTGLYAHQTGCLMTGASTLDPGFPTWGTMLREQGYKTYWYGKWHLTHGDRHWTARTGPPSLESYGFSGGTFPSPNGAPGQGWRADPHITAQFADWYAHEAGSGPWCTTVSLVNPHDIAWWYGLTDRVPHEQSAPASVHRLPANFETPQQLIERSKPTLQRSLQDTSARSFGAVPFTGPGVTARWLPFLDLYVKLQREVDRHVGHIMRTLHSRPAVAANTVIIFTSDHGEYGGSHGLRGKGAAAYEEGIRVPLIVKDPRGKLTAAPAKVRRQLTSSVDIVPLLLTIATGSTSWKREGYYAHIAGRLNLASLLRHPTAAGRPYILHTTDEIVTEFATELYDASAPLHVVALRTPHAKYVVYSNWAVDGIGLLPHGQQSELYDYRTPGGRMEIDNVAGASALQEPLDAALLHAVEHELRAPLPRRLAPAQANGIDNYLFTAKRVAVIETARRRRRRAALPHLPPPVASR
jgi:arylsulfatase A-like enzyme